MTNLSSLLTAARDERPDRIALRCDDVTFTYAELHTAATRTAALLKSSGIQPGDRVGIMLPNTAAFAILFYGIMFRGAVAVPMNPMFKGREIQSYLANTAARATGAHCWLIDDEELAELTAHLPEQDPSVERDDTDTAVILHTSGTTGNPKGAQLTHHNLRRNAEIFVRTLAQIGPDDVVLGCLPLFHIYGLTCGLIASVQAGATLTLVRFDPCKALEVIERDSVTLFEGVPTMYSALLAVATEMSSTVTASLRICTSGGASLPVQVLVDFEKTFSAKILEGYGLSETSPIAAFNHPDRPRKPGSIGTPIEGVEMRVVGTDGRDVSQGQTGEILIRGHNVMAGYWNMPEATRSAISPDGWFATGDIARIDEDGYYYIVDRKKDLIIRGGYNIYPREIEEVLYEHPAVAEAAVIGITHDSLGEEVGAAVALKAGAQASPDELRDFVKARVAAYKYPRRVWLVDTLPKGPTGKVLRREVSSPATEPVN